MRFTFDPATHRPVSSTYQAPTEEVWLEVGPARWGFTRTHVGYGDKVVTFTESWSDVTIGSGVSIARLMATRVAAACYGRLNRPERAKLAEQMAALFPAKVREVLGLSREDVEAIVAEHNAHVLAEMDRPGPAPEADLPWHERGLGGHTF